MLPVINTTISPPHPTSQLTSLCWMNSCESASARRSSSCCCSHNASFLCSSSSHKHLAVFSPSNSSLRRSSHHWRIYRTLYIFSRTENQTPFIQSNIFYVKQCRRDPEQANAGDHTCCLFIHLELLLLWLHEHEQTVLRISSSACHSFRYLPEANLTTLTSLLCHATIRLTVLIYQEV